MAYASSRHADLAAAGHEAEAARLERARGGFDLPPARFLPDATIVRLRVSPEGFARLTRFIHEHYVLEGGAPVRIRPGYYPRSWFYLANGRYHVLRNSNNWAARALLAAGVPVTPWRALTAGCLIGQVEDLGDPVGR